MYFEVMISYCASGLRQLNWDSIPYTTTSLITQQKRQQHIIITPHVIIVNIVCEGA